MKLLTLVYFFLIFFPQKSFRVGIISWIPWKAALSQRMEDAFHVKRVVEAGLGKEGC